MEFDVMELEAKIRMVKSERKEYMESVEREMESDGELVESSDHGKSSKLLELKICSASGVLFIQNLQVASLVLS